jgi:hypothetical protein
VGENLIFDGPLLREAETVLKGRPEQALATSTTSTTASPAASAIADGNAAIAGPLAAPAPELGGSR